MATPSHWWLRAGRLRPWFRVLVFVAVQAAGLVTVGLGLFAVVRAAGPAARGFALPAGLMVQSVAVVAVTFALRRLLDGESVASLGLAAGGAGRRLALGFGIGAAMQVAVLGCELVARTASVEVAPSLLAAARGLVVFVPTLVLAAAAEEIAVRGYLFANVRSEAGTRVAIAVSALLFALLHVGNPFATQQLVLTLLDLTLFGVWAALAVARTGSLWLGIGGHFAWNVFEGPVFGFPVSGLDLPTLLVTHVGSHARWFTGGAYGPEAGVVALCGLAVGFALLVLTTSDEASRGPAKAAREGEG